MAPAKGADSTKSTTFGFFWCFPSFRRLQKPEIQQIRRGLGNGFRKRSGLDKTDNFGALVVFLPFISAVPEAGNPANPTVPWKWLPVKERALQHQQLFGFHGVPLHFSGPRSRKSSKSEGALEMVSAKGADSTKSTAFGLLWGSLHFSGPRSRKSSISEGALEMASAKRADSTKSTVFGLLWCSLHFGGPRSRKSRKSEGAFEWLPQKERGSLHFGGPRSRKSSKSEGALEMASAKGADSAKSTTLELLWGSLHLSGPRNRKSSKSEGALEMASAKGAGSTKSTTFALLWGSLHFGGPRAGNPANPKGPWKWLPQKERALHNRQLFGLLWGSPPCRRSQKQEMQQIRRSTKSTTFELLWCSLHFGGHRSRKSSKSEGALEMASAQKERALQNRQLLGFCGVPSISAVPEAGNPANPKGPWKWLPQNERTRQNRQLWSSCGVPSPHFGGSRSRKSSKSEGALEMASGKGAGSTTSTTFRLLWGSPPFRRSQKPEIQQTRRGLGNGFWKRSGLYKMDNGGPEAENP